MIILNSLFLGNQLSVMPLLNTFQVIDSIWENHPVATLETLHSIESNEMK